MTTRRRKQKKPRRAPMPMHEEPGKRYWLNQLKWLLKFLNEDISNLPTGDFLKILWEFLNFFCKAEVEQPERLKELCIDSDPNRDALKQVQVLIEEFFDRIDEIRDLSFREGIPLDISGYTLEVKYSIEVDGDKLSLRPERKLFAVWGTLDLRTFKVKPPAPLDQQFDDEYLVQRGIDSSKALKFKGFVLPDFKTTIFFTLATLFERFPLDCIRRCPECRKYFTSTKRKESPLCAPCLKRENTYKWRRENPDVYNEYQRNLQKGVNDERPVEIRERLAKEGRDKNEG
jgi:hypothetical protein